MRKFLFTFITIFITLNTFGQEYIDFKYKRDFEKILKMTENEQSEVSYKKLYPRFEAADTTLTKYEVLALQIGYTKNKNYLPYQDIELEREIWELNEEKKYDEALKKCDTLLTYNPFSLIGNREKDYALRKTGKEEEAKKYYNRFEMVAFSDLSTGVGTSYENSIFVLSPADGQWIIKLVLQSNICKMGSGRDKNNFFHDILGIKMKEDGNCIDLFFNIEHATKNILTESTRK